MRRGMGKRRKTMSKEDWQKEMLLELEKCNTRIKEIKKTMRHFKNYRKWYKIVYWGMYSKQEIKDWIDKCKFILRINVKTKRSILEKINQQYGNI